VAIFAALAAHHGDCHRPEPTPCCSTSPAWRSSTPRSRVISSRPPPRSRCSGPAARRRASSRRSPGRSSIWAST